MTATTRRRGLAGLLAVFAFFAGVCARAHAANMYIPTTPAPFIVLQIGNGSVTIRTWDRPGIQFESDPSITYTHAPPRDIASRVPHQIMLWSQTIQTPVGQLTLAPEPFLLPPFAPGEHDAIIVRGDGDVTLIVPQQTPLILANVRVGSITLEDFQGTAFVAHVTAGEVHINDSSGTAAIQVNNGPIYVDNSAFGRLRLRTGRGNILMSGCRSQQIQVTSLAGSILYDNGFFEPGLAQFETDRGVVALGVANGAQIDAHAGSGRIFYDIGPDGSVNRSPNDAQATLMGGGPVVTASSVDGGVVFYRGALRDHPELERRVGPRLRNAGQNPPFP
ncbi:MAG TPA: hypothetical protein VMF11_04215 [Candidatus Baltobacteraceae bacterium]|nr:hypothetical protein [Candidatus Baltobacteraceae bacterium]